MIGKTASPALYFNDYDSDGDLDVVVTANVGSTTSSAQLYTNDLSSKGVYSKVNI